MSKLVEKEKNNIREAVDFLVPFINSLVTLLSSVKLTKWGLKKELKKLKMSDISENDWQIESSSTMLNFKINILYSRGRSFVLKIEGLSDYSGFSFMETNKGMIVHDNITKSPTSLAKDLKKEFLKHYKNPYPVTEIFLKFLAD